MHKRRLTAVLALAAAVVLLATAVACGDDDGAGGDAEAIAYASLGDSFSSGEGAPPYDTGTGKCNAAALAWPRRMYADAAGFVSIDHRACAGSRTQHLTGAWDDRDLPAQIPGEPDPTITLVTLTIGGNDLGFGDIIGSCVLAACSPKPDNQDLRAKLATLTDTLAGSVYPALVEAYPEARIAHVGYPRLTPEAGQDTFQCGWLDEADQVTAAGIVAALDAAIEAAVARSDGAVEYVDVTDAFDGHELCTTESWLNPVGLGAGYSHPNAAGQRALEVAVAEALGLTVES